VVVREKNPVGEGQGDVVVTTVTIIVKTVVVTLSSQLLASFQCEGRKILEAISAFPTASKSSSSHSHAQDSVLRASMQH
jgi:hypothetical protein